MSLAETLRGSTSGVIRTRTAGRRRPDASRLREGPWRPRVRPSWLVLVLAFALLTFSGCRSLCGGTVGVFCPQSESNPLNDAPELIGEIAFGYAVPGFPQTEEHVARNKAITVPGVTFFLLEHPSEDCDPAGPSCPVVIRDPDRDALTIEWDLDGDGTFETGKIALHGVDLEPRSTFEGFKAFFQSHGEHEVRVRVRDFPLYPGAPGDVVKTRRVQVRDFPEEENRRRNLPPVAGFVVRTSPPLAGEGVLFEAEGSYDPNGNELFYRWDFGDGAIAPPQSPRDDLHRADHRSVTHTFAAPRSYTVTLSVLDAFTANAVATQVVRVFERTETNTPPTARFSVTPRQARVGQNVRLDAGISSDPEGPIASYSWDRDGDGSFETGPGASPVQNVDYDSPGTKLVRLRVTDGDGASDTAAEEILVTSEPPDRAATGRRPLATAFTPFTADATAPAVTAAAAPAVVPFSARLTGRPLRGRRGRLRRAGSRLVLRGMLGRGSLRARALDPTAADTAAERRLRRFLTAPWRTRATLRLDRRTGRLTASAVALAQARGGRACLRLRLHDRPGRHPAGSLRTLGGSGTGSRLRAAGRFRFRLERDGAATVLGRITARDGARRRMPRACRALARR